MSKLKINYALIKYINFNINLIFFFIYDASIWQDILSLRTVKRDELRTYFLRIS